MCAYHACSLPSMNLPAMVCVNYLASTPVINAATLFIYYVCYASVVRGMPAVFCLIMMSCAGTLCSLCLLLCCACLSFFYLHHLVRGLQVDLAGKARGWRGAPLLPLYFGC
jgi:hypothetical protein